MIYSSTKTTSQLKDDFIHLLVEKEKIVELIDNPKVDTGSDLINKNVFPMIKVNFVDEAGTYIGLKVDYPRISDNSVVKDYVLIIMIVSNIDHIITQNGDNRNDLLAEEIIEMLNYNYDIGFTLKLVSDVENPLDNIKYYYRKLSFTSQTTNSLDNKLNNGV